MRHIVGISCILLGLAMLSCRVEGMRAEIASRPAALKWVRTVDGWERPDSWYLTVSERPRLHPVVVAAGQGLVSLLGLVAFRRESS